MRRHPWIEFGRHVRERDEESTTTNTDRRASPRRKIERDDR
jgi:hypothetical protein